MTAFERLYRAHRATLEAEAEILDAEDEAEVVERLRDAVGAVKQLADPTEVSFRLQVIADVASKVDDPEAVKLLIEILNDRDESVRARAGQALRAAAVRSYAQVVEGAERALDDGLEGPALLELPGLLVEDVEDEALPADVLVRLVEHEDADVVAEAACALAELDLSGIDELLASLKDDPRTLSAGGDGPRTLGELIRELLLSMAPHVLRHEGQA